MRLLTTVLAAAFFTVVSAAPQVKIGKTTLVGRYDKEFKQDFFGGIPFAEPPLGNLRLRPPVLKTRLDVKTLNASSFGPACPQLILQIPMSEDCLTINVFRPSGLPHNAKLPVLFWVYGGGWQNGASLLYNGSAIVAQSVARGTPIIYVNFNYRLGPLGFPQGQEADDQKALNLAIRDELAALEWVQHNIGAFGGDKHKVTVVGQSAGAIMSSILYLNSPLDKLARGALFQSGSQASSFFHRAARRQGNWDNFVAGVASCASRAGSNNTFDCLRRANSAEIVAGLENAITKATEMLGFNPTIDGPGGLFPDIPSRLFAQGKFLRMPFISGTDLDEGTIFIPRTINSEAQIREWIIANLTPPIVEPSQLSRAADRMLELYPDNPALGSPFNTGDETFGLSSQFKRATAIHGDLGFHSQRRFWQQTAAKAGVKTWGYLFTQPQPQLLPSEGVAHGAEIAYLYGHPNDTSPSALRASALVIDYWVSFVSSLDPNDGKGLKRPTWERYTPYNERIIQLHGDNTTMIPDTFRKKQMDFINSVPAVFLHRRESEGSG